jgi:hypothetical protein
MSVKVKTSVKAGDSGYNCTPRGMIGPGIPCPPPSKGGIS